MGHRRVPLHPGDAAKFRQQHNDALTADDQRRSEMFAAEMLRLDALAKRKNEYDRMQPGPLDQQLSYDMASEDIGVPASRKPEPSFDTWATSDPESRNIPLHILSIPENFVYQATEALSENKPDIASRLLASVPGAFYPPSGYPVEPGRDRMYEELGPVTGLAIEMAMPGVADVSKPLRGAYRAADRAFRFPIRTELVDEAGDVIRRLRNAQ